MALTVTFFVIAIISFYLGYIKGKDTSKKEMIDLNFEKFFKYAYKEEIHPVTKDIYDLFISDNGMRHFQKHEHTIKIPMLGIEIWHKNGLVYREIYKDSNKRMLFNLYGKTIEEINNSLNLGDKTILDRICREVIINENDLADTILLDSRFKL